MKKEKQRRIKSLIITVLGLVLIGLAVCAGIRQERLSANPIEKRPGISTRAVEPQFVNYNVQQFTLASTPNHYGVGGLLVTGKLSGDVKDNLAYLQLQSTGRIGVGFVREDLTFRVDARQFYEKSEYTEEKAFGVGSFDRLYVENMAGQRIYANNSTTPFDIKYITQTGEQNDPMVSDVRKDSLNLSFTLLGAIAENLNTTSSFQMRNLLEDKYNPSNGDLIWDEVTKTSFTNRTTTAQVSDLKPGTPYEFRWIGPQLTYPQMPTSNVQIVTLLGFKEVVVTDSSTTSATITGVVEGRYFPDEGIKVAYRKKGTDDEWASSTAKILKTEGNETTFEMSLSGLDVATEYEYHIQGYNSRFSILNNDWITGPSGEGVLCQSEIQSFETLEQPLYTVDVQVGALDKDGNFGMIPFAPLAPPSETSDPYVTVLETTAPTMPEPENAISPTDPGADAEFTFPTTYDFEVGTGKSYQVTQTENVNNDYTKPNQATSPVFSINDQNQLVVDENVVNDLPYKDGDFILSWDATNKKLTIQIINQPNGEYQLVSVATLDYDKVSLPQKNPGELIKRQDANWKVQFTDTRLDAYRTPLKLSVKLDQNFTKVGDSTKTISGILLYRPNATTPITPDAFLIEGEEIPIKEKINPNSGTNDIDWPEQAGFLLQIDAEKQTKIFAGDYQAELTFILSEDPL